MATGQGTLDFDFGPEPGSSIVYNSHTVAVGPVSTSVPFVSNTSQYYDSIIVVDQEVLPNLVNNSSSVFSPTIYQYEYTPSVGYTIVKGIDSSIITDSVTNLSITNLATDKYVTYSAVSYSIVNTNTLLTVLEDTQFIYLNAGKAYYL